MLREKNQSLKIASKEIDLAKNEHERLNAFWYPSLSATGAYVHMSNKIEVKEPLSQFTDPAKDFVHTIIPNDQIISSILDKIGAYSLSFPLAPKDLTTIDANITWPIFTGGKRKPIVAVSGATCIYYNPGLSGFKRLYPIFGT